MWHPAKVNTVFSKVSPVTSVTSMRWSFLCPQKALPEFTPSSRSTTTSSWDPPTSDRYSYTILELQIGFEVLCDVCQIFICCDTFLVYPKNNDELFRSIMLENSVFFQRKPFHSKFRNQRLIASVIPKRCLSFWRIYAKRFRKENGAKLRRTRDWGLRHRTQMTTWLNLIR